MRKLHLLACLVLSIGSFTACSQADMEAKSFENQEILVETQVRQEQAVTIPPTVEPMPTEAVTVPLFVNPLDEITPSVLPEHIQLTVGEDISTSLYMTLILEGSGATPELLLVDATNRQIMSVAGRDVTEEDVASVGLQAFTFELKGLTANLPYEYAFETNEGWTHVYTFKLPSEHVSSRVAIFGDLQGYKLSQYMTYQSVFDAAFNQGSVDLNFLMGDIVDTGDAYDQWDFYYQAMAGRGEASLFATCIGNHDVKGSRDFYNSTYAYAFNGLETLPQSTGYFDLPFARVAMIDTEKPSTFEEQQSWLKQVMADNDKAHSIVMMHRSVFPIFYVEPHMQGWAEVFEALGIDLVLSGHDHIYSRTTINEVTYVVTGSGSGSKFYDKSDDRPWQGFIYDEDEPVYLILDVKMDGLTLQSYAFIDGNSQLIDHVEMP